jgi:small multidrug resistance pump
MTLLLLAAAILCEVAATLSLEGSETTPALYAVVAVGYLAAFAFFRYGPQARHGTWCGYGIWGASGVALTAVLSALIFNEAFTLAMGGGLLLIIAGVLLVETGSHSNDTHTAATTKDGQL